MNFVLQGVGILHGQMRCHRSTVTCWIKSNASPEPHVTWRWNIACWVIPTLVLTLYIIPAKGFRRGVGIKLLFQQKVLHGTLEYYSSYRSYTGAVEYYSSERSYPRCLEQPVAVPLLDEPVGHAVRQLVLTAVDQGSQRVGGRH